jgi:hypothetical protein
VEELKAQLDPAAARRRRRMEQGGMLYSDSDGGRGGGGGVLCCDSGAGWLGVGWGWVVGRGDLGACLNHLWVCCQVMWGHA